jgi:hypothetical protein
MKIKLDAEGKPVFGSNGLPVYVNDDGSDYGEFDAKATLAAIKARNEEAKQNRIRAETAEAAARAFEGIDVTEARKAIETVANLDGKRLVDAGQVEKLRSEITSAYEAKLAKETETRQAIENKLISRTINAAFAGSKFIGERLSVPADMVQKTFSDNFRVENDSVIAIDANGHPITSKRDPGRAADFDEALEILVEGYAHKDSILRSTQAGGTGAPSNGGMGNGNRHVDSTKLGGSREERTAAIAAKFGLPPS